MIARLNYSSLFSIVIIIISVFMAIRIDNVQNPSSSDRLTEGINGFSRKERQELADYEYYLSDMDSEQVAGIITDVGTIDMELTKVETEQLVILNNVLDALNSGSVYESQYMDNTIIIQL